MQKSTNRLDVLDWLRGIAILGVAVCHCLSTSYGFDQLGWTGSVRDWNAPVTFLLLLPLSFGSVGVSIFFVVSGFCIHHSHARSREPGFAVFFIRRLFRIYPPYLAFLLLFSLVPPWGGPDRESFPAADQFGSHVLLLHNLGARWFFSINPSFWSIAVEVQLYVLYPIVWFLAAKRGWSQTLLLTGGIEFCLRLAATAWSLLHPHDSLPQCSTSSPFSFWFSWCIGAALAEAHLRGNLPVVTRAQLWLAAALTVGSYFSRLTIEFMFPLAAVATAGSIAYLLRSHDQPAGAPPLARCLPYLSQLGVVSYSYYLLHQPIIKLVPGWVDVVLPGVHRGLVYFAACLASLIPIYLLSTLSFRLLERPSTAAGKRMVEWRKSCRGAPAFARLTVADIIGRCRWAFSPASAPRSPSRIRSAAGSAAQGPTGRE